MRGGSKPDESNEVASQPPQGWRCGAVQCRGALGQGDRGRGGTRAPCRRGWRVDGVAGALEPRPALGRLRRGRRGRRGWRGRRGGRVCTASGEWGCGARRPLRPLRPLHARARYMHNGAVHQMPPLGRLDARPARLARRPARRAHLDRVRVGARHRLFAGEPHASQLVLRHALVPDPGEAGTSASPSRPGARPRSPCPATVHIGTPEPVAPPPRTPSRRHEQVNRAQQPQAQWSHRWPPRRPRVQTTVSNLYAASACWCMPPQSRTKRRAFRDVPLMGGADLRAQARQSEKKARPGVGGHARALQRV